ncbi:MAG TPA: bifunctional 4-hydroxy-2-oxoglutarate aldolase/2-dehydro-3-deoxy-phosphogluconate aldolase [Puia sp.]|jgi:2-dehydro-3-deoxyphosphogluconate aldolase/(4S)-4-hydroxy-2-oxoglutarate aldolase
MLSSFLTKQILPAVTLQKEEDALPVAEAMMKGGLEIMEITFRTDIAARAIRRISTEYPEMIVGAGTILNTSQLQMAIDSGARFALSPAFNAPVCTEAKRLDFPFIPGIMTPTEMEAAYGLDYRILKLFPSEQIGGIAFLKSLSGPYGHLGIQFIPMGGVTLQNMDGFLKIPGVIAIGGSWLASQELIAEKNYPAITENVRRALQKVNN